MNEANYQANRKTLAANLKASFGLPDAAADWTYEQRQNYNRAFATYIKGHPNSFSDTDMQNALAILGEGANPLQDDSFSFSEFSDAALDNAKPILAAGGNILKNAIYIIVVGAVIVYGAPILIEKLSKSKTT